MSAISNSKGLTGIISFVTGFVFAIGLIVAQMVDPNKVVAFLRIFKNWDPSLGLVMGGAIAVAMPAFFYAKAQSSRGNTAINGNHIELPKSTKITRELIVGSILFGIGWGMLGFCPAPAVVSVFAGYSEALIFTIAMLFGFFIQSKVAVKRRAPA